MELTDPSGRPPLRRRLIVNADDFGHSHGINKGVARTHLGGIVTSASLMVRWPASEEAAAYAREHPDLSLGLHVDLGEWVYRAARWVPLYRVVDADDVSAVQLEVRRQLAVFRALTGGDPTHIDSHQHVHRSALLLPIFQAIAQETGAFLREDAHGIKYDGRFYGWDRQGVPVPGAIRVEALLRIIETLEPGLTELGCHPGLDNDMVSVYRAARLVETETLCHQRLVSAIIEAGVELSSFHDARDARVGSSDENVEAVARASLEAG